MDRLESMEVFVDVVSSGSLAATAERRGLSPSMVGKHIQFLESELGVQLLQKTTRRHRLTEAGELYLEKCREILRLVTAANESASTLKKGPAGLLRISAPISFGVSELAPALAEFLNLYPEVRIELTLTDASVDTMSIGVDVAFRIGPLADSWLVARPLAPYRMVVCASPKYLARRGTPVSPQDLTSHNCLGHTRWGLRHAWHFEGSKGMIDVPLEYRIRIDNGPALRAAAIAGAGIIMQPQMLVSDDLRAGRLKRILENFKVHPRPFYIVHAKDKSLPTKLKAFVEFALERFSE